MRVRQVVCGVCLSAVTGLAAGTASGQEFPTKPVRLIVPGVGNSFDVAARHIAQAISVPLGQPVLVDNRPPGVIPGQIVSQAAPDGHTLLYTANSLWLGPFLQVETPYDVIRDFVPVMQTTRSPLVLVVHPSLPVNSVRDVIALAKARPGQLNYASGAIGSANHLTAELFKSMAGKLNIVRIGYKGSGPALNDMIAGQVQMMFSVTGSVAPHLKSGRLKSLAVSSAQPTELMPGVPTIASSGLPGFEAAGLAGVFAPARTPRAIVDRLNREISRALGNPDLKEKFLNVGVEIVAGTPEQFAAAMKAEMQSMGRLIKEAGIREN
jgi:tripartite-type tricarboxylate transporter receptor subunit TctC